MSRGKRGEKKMITLNWAGYKIIDENGIKKLPQFAGVYKLSTYFPATEKYKPFYVGQADNIYSRTVQHTGESEKNSCVKENFKKYAIYINYAEVRLQSERDGVEVALYNNYKPSCNDEDALPDAVSAEVDSFN